MKLLLAGDTHGSTYHMNNVFAHACRVEADVIFQLGDFGFGWSASVAGVDDFTHDVSQLTERTGVPCYWLPGNHEGYWALAALLARLEPEADGTFQTAPGVFYVPRGTMLEWDGIRFLCCGGATSVDRDYRKPGESWWPEEMLTEEDVQKCIAATKENPADVLLSHDFPFEITVVDRHLAPHWGERAQADTIASRQRVSRILDASGARYAYHGHLHLKYDESMKTISGRDVEVHGLDCDGTPMSTSTLLLDTETLRD